MQKGRKPRHPDRWLAALFLLPSALAVAVFVYGLSPGRDTSACRTGAASCRIFRLPV